MCTTPQQVVQFPNANFINHLIGISGGGGHCLFLDQNGLLYSCGWNNKGQLGINTIENKAHITEIPASIFNGAKISQIETGKFSLILTNKLKLDPKTYYYKFVAGWDCSAAIDSTGELYLWGSNLYEQMGTAKTDVLLALSPRKTVLPGQEKCIKVQFGLRTACFVTESCTYFVGISKSFEHFKTMNNVQLIQWNGIDYWKFDATIVHIAGGQNHFTFCTNEFRGIQGFGDDRFSQSCMVPLSNENIVNVLKSGWTHNGFLNQNGEVFLWGRNNYGQIGNCAQKKPLQIYQYN